ncbi:MAG: hypothetical protein AB7G44_02055 [Bacteroidia bacterium]
MKGLDDFAKRRANGDFVVDTRLAVRVNPKMQVSFIVKNIGNLEYANRPGVVDPPRNYTLQLRYTF